MIKSSSDALRAAPSAPAPPPATAPQPAAISRFSLWPLPELHQPAVALATPVVAPGPDLEQAAHARGYEAGRAAAIEEANRTLKRAAGLLVSTAEALDAARLGVVRELEDSVYLLGLAVARHLIQREVSADPTIVRDLVHKGLEAFPVGSRVEIHLHPDDLAALRSQVELPGTDGRAAEIMWSSDPAIERGGCTLETPHRVVDGRIDLALSDLYHRMRDD
jgi:flagellar biosynthesis/type III secretory pathway protein FliH